MAYIIIDTEGTGLFRTKNILPDGTKVLARSDEPGQPRMAEYAHVLLNDNFEVESKFQQYIIPEGWEHEDGTPMLEMPAGAFEANKLTFKFLRLHGRPVREALQHYLACVEGRVFIGFNQQHDGRQLRGELRRAGLPDRFEETPSICAMRSLQSARIKIRKLNGLGGYPRLIDAAAHFGVPGYEEEKRHRALEDALATAHIARELYHMDRLLPAAVHRAANHPDNQGALL
jgi:DNA polymerase-3 subunit epsilon